MEDFTNDQTAGIATGYRSMARALNEYQFMHWPALSHEQHLDLNAYQNSLLNRARDLQDQVTRPAFPNAASVATTIQKATTDARINLKRIGNLTVALNVGAIVVTMAAYVARANTGSMPPLLRELGELLERESKA